METNDYHSTQDRFAKALYRLQQAFNLLDLNLGYCIRFLENPDDVEKSHGWLSRASLAEKIDRFAKLSSPEYLDVSEVELWVEQAHKARVDRNLCAHVYYDVAPTVHGNDPLIMLPPWMPSVLKACNNTMSIESLEEIVINIEGVLEQFGALRRKGGI